MKYYLNQHLFLIFEGGEILVWDYKSHNQFLLNLEYFQELLKISETGAANNPRICDEFQQAGLISATPFPENEWGWDPLSKIFHIGCQNVGSSEEMDSFELAKTYLEHCKALSESEKNLDLFSDKGQSLITLPEPDLASLEKVSYLQAIKQRKTCRNFTGDTITLERLSSILYASFGLIHGEWKELQANNPTLPAMRKAAPASGGLHSEEAYVVAYRVKNLDNGLYHYRPQDHKLAALKIGNFEQQVIKMNMNQFFSEGMAFGIYITSRLEKLWWKYKHSRAYRVALLDLGHVSQTFLLSATAVGLKTWITGSFADSEIDNFLGIDGHKESVILYVGAGEGTGQAIPEKMLAQIK